MADRTRLDSWKEIARYLGRDVRTVIRWEQQRGLPVCRVPGGKVGRVFAYSDELDAWFAHGATPVKGTIEHSQKGSSLAAQEGANSEGPGSESAGADSPGSEPAVTNVPDDPLRRWRRSVATLTLVAGIAIGGFAVTWGLTARFGVPRRLVLIGNAVSALDASGQAVWTHAFPDGDVHLAITRWSEIIDVDADGHDDALATLEIARPPLNAYAGTLLRFKEDGTLLWSSVAGDRVAFRDGEYGPPWASADFAVYRAPGGPRIAWALHHYTWWPGLLVTLDTRGRREHTFVNSGWIRSVLGSRDGRHLYISGITNQSTAYFFAVLDAAHPSGRSPETPGSPFECLSCPEGDPVRYFVFPRPDVGREQPFPQNGPVIQTFEDSTVQIQSLDSGGPNVAATIYDFSQGFGEVRASFSNSFWEWHRRLESDGRLHHRAEDCPERRGREIRSWTRAGGWQTLHVPVR